MAIKVEKSGQLALVKVDGDLEMALADSLSRSVAGLLDEPDCRIIIDLADCSYVDSSGLGALLDISKSCHKKGCELRLSGLNDNVRDVFLMTRLDRYFKIVFSVEEAKLSLAAG